MLSIKPILIFLTLLFICTSVFSQEYYSESESSSLVTITTKNHKKYNGTILEDSGDKIKLQTKEYGIIVFSKENILDQSPFDAEAEQKSVVEMKELKEYVLTPTAFNLKKGQSSMQTHYFGFWNWEKGVTDNFSIDMGFTYPLVMPLKIGVKGSVAIAKGLRIGCKLNAFTFIDLYGVGNYNSTSTVQLAVPVVFLLQASPMLTIGNNKTNFTVGANINHLTNVGETAFSGFAGGFMSLNDRVGIYGEFIALLKNDNWINTEIYSGSLGIKYYRNERKVWTFGLSSAIFPTTNYSGGVSRDVYFVLPLPYIGYRFVFR